MRCAQLGKDVRVVNRDPAPAPLQVFPGVAEIEVADRVDDPGDAVIVMESATSTRTGIEGLDRGFVINIDHHLGNSMYGALNWFDLSAAACGEMVFDLVQELGVPLTVEIATHVYVAILTDTGSFHYSSISPRTFDICRQCVEAGVDPPVGRPQHLRQQQSRPVEAVRRGPEPDGAGCHRPARHRLRRPASWRAACGGTYEDTEGLINLPLTVKEIQAVVFFKEHGPDDWRVSMRSKGDVDINAVAKAVRRRRPQERLRLQRHGRSPTSSRSSARRSRADRTSRPHRGRPRASPLL